MKVFLILLMGSALAWASSSFACTLNDERNKTTYQLNLPDDQCSTIAYIDGRIIPIRLSYPQGQAIGSSWRGPKIDVRIYYADAGYKIGPLIDKNTYLKTENNTDIYRTPNEEFFAFNGEDGARVFIRNRIHTWVASRMYGGIVINYQYLKGSLSFSEADEFVMQFVNKTIVKRD